MSSATLLPGRLAAVAAGLLACLLLVGAIFARRGDPRPAVHLIAGWDTSGSARPRLGALAGLGSAAIRRLDPHRDRATLFRMDCRTDEFFDGPVPGGAERVGAILSRALAPPPARSGTAPDRFWTAAAAAARRSNLPVIVLLLTDGGRDDTSSAANHALASAARRLAENSRVIRVCVWGVLPPARDALRTELHALQDRLEVRGLEDVDLDNLLRRPRRTAS